MSESTKEGRRSQTAATTPPKRKRKKRSWSSVTMEIEGRKWTFWLTPAGVHLRLKSSRVVRTKNYMALRDFVSDQLTMPL
jgi:hypothetical protein